MVFMVCLFTVAVCHAQTGVKGDGVKKEAVGAGESEERVWAKENTDEIRRMSRSELVKLSRDKQLAAYLVLTKEQRVNLWKDKFESTLKMPCWSAEEKTHIQKAYDFILAHQDSFGDERLTDEQEKTLGDFIKGWSDEATAKFGWDRNVIGSIVATLDDAIAPKR